MQTHEDPVRCDYWTQMFSAADEPQCGGMKVADRKRAPERLLRFRIQALAPNALVGVPCVQVNQCIADRIESRADAGGIRPGNFDPSATVARRLR